MIEALYRILKSLGYDHPIHAPITHMPIGLIAGALVFFLVAAIFKRKELALSARHASILALVFAFPTILFGVFDWIHFYHAALIPAIEYKMVLAGIVLVLLGLGIILGGETKANGAAMAVIYALSFAAVVGLGYFGGGLVFGRSEAAPAPSIGVSEPGPGSGAAAASSGSGGAETGETLFEDNCSSCHPGGGNAIEPTLPVKGSKRLASAEGFEAFLRAPVMPDGKPGSMPPFDEGTLSDDQVAQLFAFVRKGFK